MERRKTVTFNNIHTVVPSLLTECTDAVIFSTFYLLGLGQYSYDFSIEVCYSVHVASVRTMIPVRKQQKRKKIKPLKN